jgi:hypothetical protein
MPSAKRVASRSPSPSPSAGGGGALGLTIKARYVRYKETEGSVVWQPDLAAASELSLVVVLILQGLTSIEFLQQACTCVAGVLAALCVYPHAHAHPALLPPHRAIYGNARITVPTTGGRRHTVPTPLCYTHTSAPQVCAIPLPPAQGLRPRQV